MKRAVFAPAILFLAMLVSCAPAPEPTAGGTPSAGGSIPIASGPEPAGETPIFDEVAAASGLDFVHVNGMTGEYYYPEMMGAGVALLDYDGDGDLDVYLVQGGSLEGGADDVEGPKDRLFRNDLEPGGPPRFTDVTDQAGIDARGYGFGAVAADFDNDGHVDLYLTNLGANQLWRNRGDGTFEEIGVPAGVAETRWSVPAAVLDFDADGRLDLYVGNYVEWNRATDPDCTDELGMRNYCGPLAFAPEPDTLYHNRTEPGGETRFENVSAAAGIRAEYGATLGVVAADFDADGRIDVYVGNDGKPNQLWRNETAAGNGGLFTNQALLAGVAVNAGGHAEASMGIAAADFDADGDEDLFITHLARETHTLYVNDGRGMFDDRSIESGLGPPSLPYTGFGTAFFDWDNDGWLDLMAVHGAVKVIKSQALAGNPLPLAERNHLYRNRGPDESKRVTFAEVTERAGSAFELVEVSRGAAFGDLDNDGDTDVVVANNHGPARLLLNRVGQDRPWLGLRLVLRANAAGAVRDAWGARATVICDGREQVLRIGGAASYASASDPRLLFGLGECASASAAVRVRWPGGRAEEWQVDTGRYTTLVAGSGRRLGEESR